MALLGDSPLCLSRKSIGEIIPLSNFHTSIVANIRLEVILGGVFKYFLFSSLLGEMIHFDQYFSDGLKPPTSIWFVFERSLRFRFDPICQFGLLHVRFNCPCGSPRDDGRKKRRGPVWDPGLIWIHPSKGAIWTLRDGVQGPLIHSAHLGRSRYMNYLYIYSVEWLPTLIRAVTHWELCISQFLVEDSHFASPGRTESKIESQSSGGTVAGPVLPTKSAKSFR